MQEQAEIVLGLDFGSTSSSVSYYNPETKTLESVSLGNHSNFKTFNSGIAIDLETDQLFIGLTPKDLNFSQKYFYIVGLKQKLVNKEPLIYKGKVLKIHFLLSKIFIKLKEEVQLKCGFLLDRVILTVPAYFSEQTRHVIKDAAKLSGLSVLRIINEPTAAAIYYAYNNKNSKQTCLIIDVGGLTLDMSICNVLSEVIDVVETYGDCTGGHYRVDLRIYDKLMEQLQRQNEKLFVQIKSRQKTDLQILQHSEQLKKVFSDSPNEQINFISEYIKQGDRILLEYYFTKKQLMHCYNDFTLVFSNVYANLLKKSGYKETQINKVLLIGGPASSALLRSLVSKVVKIPIEPYFDNLTSVSKGAALYGAQLAGHLSMNILSDVLPISIGVELEGGIFEKIINSGSKLPCFKIKEFTTSEDYQTTVRVKIFQGERLLVSQCNYLGELTLRGVELGLRGNPVIKVMLEVTEQGVINAFVMDLHTKKMAEVKISSVSRLSQLQLEQIRTDYQRYYATDLDFITLIQLRSKINRLKSLIQTLISTVNDTELHSKYDYYTSKIQHFLKYKYKEKNSLSDLLEQLNCFVTSIKLASKEQKDQITKL